MINKTHPGLPNYTGPTKGNFTFLHHEIPAERSDNIDERIDYILQNKPTDELDTRLASIVYLPPGSPCGEAGAVYAKARSEAWAVCDKARGEAGAVYAKARGEAGAVYAKALSEAGAVYAKALSEALAVLLPTLKDIMPLDWNGKGNILA